MQPLNKLRLAFVSMKYNVHSAFDSLLKLGFYFYNFTDQNRINLMAGGVDHNDSLKFFSATQATTIDVVNGDQRIPETNSVRNDKPKGML